MSRVVPGEPRSGETRDRHPHKKITSSRARRNSRGEPTEFDMQ